MATVRRLTEKQISDARKAMAYLIADWETMSTEADRQRTRTVGNGIRVIERLLAAAAPLRKRQGS